MTGFPALNRQCMDRFEALRPLRLGWLKHRNIGIARGIDPVSDEDSPSVL